jgi:hypothetical protein
MKMDFNRFAREWVSAWNAHDLELILADYADDVELISPLVPRLTDGNDDAVRGKAALRAYFACGLQAFPTLRFELIRCYPGLRSCVVEYHSVNGRRSAELMEFNSFGKVCRVLAHYCDESEPSP